MRRVYGWQADWRKADRYYVIALEARPFPLVALVDASCVGAHFPQRSIDTPPPISRLGRYDRALGLRQPPLEIPYYRSPVWLHIDPTFASPRGNPRFEKLIASS